MSTQLEKWKEEARAIVKKNGAHLGYANNVLEDLDTLITQIATQSAEARDEEWRKAISNIIQNSEGSQDWFNGLRACKSISFPPTTS